jgi:hypothetical protein
MIRKYMMLLIGVLALALAVTGCPTDVDDDDENPVLYKVIVDGLLNGSITVNPGNALAGGVEAGTAITLAAQPAPGYTVAEIHVNSGEGAVPLTPSEAGKYTFAISGDVQVSARFSVLTEIPIGSGEDLAKIGKDPAYPPEGHYYLTGNIDLAAFDPWTPIGTSIVVANPDEYYHTGREFTGTFDGKNYTIQNLRLNGAAVYTGLFGYTLFATIKDVTIRLAAENVTLSGGKQFAGAAAGFAVGTDISGVTVESDLTLVGGYQIYAGNVVGYALYSTPRALAAAGNLDVSGSGDVYAGGIIGYAESSPLGSGYTATGAVRVSGGSSGYAGGVAGYASASPIGSGTYGTGSVFVEGGSSAYGGGIAGYASDSAITGVSVGRAVIVKGVSSYVSGGGIVGYATSSSSISEATASGAVTVTATGSATTNGGGIAGHVGSSSSISESVASGAVAVTAMGGSINAGGIAGNGSSAITGSRATGTVTAEGTGTVYAGGLTGYTTSGGVTGSSATGDVFVVSSGSTIYAGGLTGYSSGSASSSITRSYAEGIVSARGTGTTTNVYVGGLGGSASNPISDSYATGEVTGEGPNVRAGGLVGNTASYTVSRCYAAGAVTGNTTNATASSNGVGGLVGITTSSASTIIEYSVAWVPSVSISANSVNVGRVNGLKGASAVLRGNAALTAMILTNNDGTAVPPTDSADGKDGASKDTSYFEDQDNYSDEVDAGGLGWDFTDTWKWDSANGRPILAWQ